MEVAHISVCRTVTTIAAAALLVSTWTSMGKSKATNTETQSDSFFAPCKGKLNIFFIYSRSCDQSPEKLLLYARKRDLRLKQLHPKKQTDSLDMVSYWFQNYSTKAKTTNFL